VVSGQIEGDVSVPGEVSEVDNILDRVDEDIAVRIRDSELSDKYLVRENGVVIRVDKILETGKWKRVLYSNLVSVQRTWIDQALNSEWSSFTGVDLIPRSEVPEIEGTSCISRYCQGDELYVCRECGEEIVSGIEFARHAWDRHGITEDPREYRDPARGQMSLGDRWST
jgi:hypothetical protein